MEVGSKEEGRDGVRFCILVQGKEVGGTNNKDVKSEEVFDLGENGRVCVKFEVTVEDAIDAAVRNEDLKVGF